jgi:hypothetical protein
MPGPTRRAYEIAVCICLSCKGRGRGTGKVPVCWRYAIGVHADGMVISEKRPIKPFWKGNPSSFSNLAALGSIDELSQMQTSQIGIRV